MTATLIPNADDLRIAEQLAMAKAMRDRGMTGTGGSGMAGQVYMVGNQYGNLAQNLGGSVLSALNDRDQQELSTRQRQAEDAALGAIPSGALMPHAYIARSSTRGSFGTSMPSCRGPVPGLLTGS